MKLNVTPAVVDSLREARRIIREEEDSYICHAVLHSQDISLAEDCDPLGICDFVKEGILFTFYDGEPGFGTFESWVENTVPEWNKRRNSFSVPYVIGEGLVRECRAAWLDRMLYVIERGATALYHDGQWEAADGTLMTARGVRSIFDDVDE